MNEWTTLKDIGTPPIILNLGPCWRCATANITPRRRASSTHWRMSRTHSQSGHFGGKNFHPSQKLVLLNHNIGPGRLGNPASLLVYTFSCHNRVTNNFTIHVCRVLCRTILILRHIIHPCNRNDVRHVTQSLFNIILHHPNVHMISPVKLRAFFVQKFMFIYMYI